MLNNKKIIVGVSGGIAAYKAVELIRRLKDFGAEVRVVMTENATQFVGPLTFQAVSGYGVHHVLFDEQAEAAMGHIELARWADLIIVAPASANTIAKLSHGLADDLLSTLCLASPSSIAIVPAMNQQMWANAAVKHNVRSLMERHGLCWGPASGAQACGDVGQGRMIEPQEIVEHVLDFFSVIRKSKGHKKLLSGKKVLLTVGPTREAIDPVRYISNHSSGKMGYALAKAALEHGAEVTVVSGPVTIAEPEGMDVIKVTSAVEMLEAVDSFAASSDIFIACAAVADYRVSAPSTQKIKKTSDKLSLKLEPNPDILATIASKYTHLFCVGFAAETDNVAEYAEKKLKAKQINLICANDVSEQDIGFNSEYNALLLMAIQGSQLLSRRLNKNTKPRIAEQVIEYAAELMEVSK